MATPSAAAPTLNADFDRFIKWFGGEWNNNEQVWQQQIDIKTKPADEKIAHIHHIFAPVVAPNIGKHVYYVQQSLDGDLTKSYRQRVYRMTPDERANAVKLEIFNLPDDKLYFDAHKNPQLFANLNVSQLRATPGCEVYW
ncbi:MAG: chromophore lyase CpcT/CpeT, partial [Aeromicrobium sp.]|nr:chromophore lyase CpcT/CpeT [Burkholderiales bacterium]